MTALGVGGVGIATVTDGSGVVGTTGGDLWRAILRRLGNFQEFAASGASSGTNSVVAASTADSEAVASKFGGQYLYAPSGVLAGEQRRIQRRGFTGASGTYATTGGYPTTPQSGQAWWRCGTIPAVEADGLLGVREACNRMLTKLWVVDRYPLTYEDGVVTYELGALWWATRSRFKRLIAPAIGPLDHPYPGDQPWDIRQDGELWYLELHCGFRDGDTFWLEVEMPANARLYTAANGWAYTTSPSAGLVLPSDACLGEFNALYQCGLLEAMEALAVQAGGARKAFWRHEIDKPGGQRETVGVLKAYDLEGVELALGEGKTAAAGTNGPGWDGPKSWRGFVRGGYS